MNFEHWRHYARGWLFHFFNLQDRAYEEFSVAFRIDSHDVRSARHLAAIATNKQQFVVAERWFETVVGLDPDDGPNWFNLGFVRERMGRSREAIAAFAEAVRLVPTLDRAWYGMGLAHARIGEHAEAAAALQKAVDLQPMNGEGWYQLGMAQHHANQPDEVKRIVRRLVDFEPKRARQLAQDASRADLMKYIPELPF